MKRWLGRIAIGLAVGLVMGIVVEMIVPNSGLLPGAVVYLGWLGYIIYDWRKQAGKDKPPATFTADSGGTTRGGKSAQPICCS